MRRAALFALLLLCATGALAFGQPAPGRHMEYTRSHRVTFEQEWKYSFADFQSSRWLIALSYPPALAWNKDVTARAELLTSKGWVPFKEVKEESKLQRRMFRIDYPHDDAKLRYGFTIRTTLTATLYDQRLEKGKPRAPVPALSAAERRNFLASTQTYDFLNPTVKKWMDEHKMWLGKDEKPADFVLRLCRELRRTLPYNTKDPGRWSCSQVLKAGYGECYRHSIVGTSILRANKVPARTVCGPWAINDRSKGVHCWGEVYLEGIGWIPYDTTYNVGDRDADRYVGNKPAAILAVMMDFDWVVDAGPAGKQTVFAPDVFPAYWGVGKGNPGKAKVDTTTRVRVVKRFR
jgi:transglutaminase-like putative cysteine protease